MSSGIIIILPMTTTAAFAATITGTNGNDVLKGTDSRDTIRARGGDDRVYGFKGNDALYGGRGNDRIRGGSGNDQIYAWHGDNYVSGGEGRDIIYATGGPTRPGGPATDDYNRLYGYGGNDRFKIRQASATIYGGSGHDNVDVAAGDLARGGFWIYTEAGNDYVLAAADNGARVYGGPGNDKLISRGESHNYMFGDDGNDYIQIDHDSGTDAHGGPGNDHLVNVFEGRLHGEDGDDVLESRTSTVTTFDEVLPPLAMFFPAGLRTEFIHVSGLPSSSLSFSFAMVKENLAGVGSSLPNLSTPFSFIVWYLLLCIEKPCDDATG